MVEENDRPVHPFLALAGVFLRLPNVDIRNDSDIYWKRYKLARK
jgi:hypothetical protein